MKIKKPAARVERLEIANIPAFGRPKFTDTLFFPDDITRLTAVNLSELMGKYAKLLAFVEQEATSWRISELRMQQRLDDLRTQILLEEPKLLFLERWKQEVKLNGDDRVRAVLSDMNKVGRLKQRAESLVRTYERLGQVLSRELSRRLSTGDSPRYTPL